MYIYNDIVFKVLFGTPENEKITVDFLNRLIIGTVFVSKIRKMKFFTRLFALLQEKAKLSVFTEDFLVSEAMKMSDHNYELYVEKKHARAEGLAEGRAEGRAEGIEEERKRADSERRNRLQMMLADGMSKELASKYSGILLNEI